mgnify:FL=1
MRPAGDFKSYTIRLQSGVNLRIDANGIIRAARADLYDWYGNQTMVGEGGNYDEPEVNLYAGLQDHGHTYFANSLFYAADKHDIMIYGEGLIDGSYMDDTGTLINVLSGTMVSLLYLISNPAISSFSKTRSLDRKLMS